MHCVQLKEDLKWREFYIRSTCLRFIDKRPFLPKMAENRFSSWNEDDLLKGALQTYVKQGLQREEAIDFLRKDFTQYAWSVRTLDRRLRYFEVYYKDDTVSVEDVKEAVKKELEGLGKLLGYRSMHKKIRQKYDLLVTRDQVYDVMFVEGNKLP